MTTHVQKWGNSLAVRLPKELVEKIHLSEGGSVSIESRDGALIIRPAVKPETLESMVKKITPRNRHGEVLSDNAVGLEIW